MVSGTRRVAAALAALVVLGAGAEAASARSSISKATAAPAGCGPRTRSPRSARRCEMGVTTLELDTGVTKDGVVVVSHERRISSLECHGPVRRQAHPRADLRADPEARLRHAPPRRPLDRPVRRHAGGRPRHPHAEPGPGLPARQPLRRRPASSSTSRPSATRRCPRRPSGPTTFAQEGHRGHLALPHDQARGPSVLRLEHAAGRAQDQAAPAPRALAQETTIFPGHAVDRRHRRSSPTRSTATSRAWWPTSSTPRSCRSTTPTSPTRSSRPRTSAA